MDHRVFPGGVSLNIVQGTPYMYFFSEIIGREGKSYTVYRTKCPIEELRAPEKPSDGLWMRAELEEEKEKTARLEVKVVELEEENERMRGEQEKMKGKMEELEAKLKRVHFFVSFSLLFMICSTAILSMSILFSLKSFLFIIKK